MWLNKKKIRQEHLEGKVVTICESRGGSLKFNIAIYKMKIQNLNQEQEYWVKTHPFCGCKISGGVHLGAQKMHGSKLSLASVVG